MLKQNISVFWYGGVCAGCAAQPGPRSNLGQFLASGETWHMLLLGAVTLEEAMETHLGKGDTSSASVTS